MLLTVRAGRPMKLVLRDLDQPSPSPLRAGSWSQSGGDGRCVALGVFAVRRGHATVGHRPSGGAGRTGVVGRSRRRSDGCALEPLVRPSHIQPTGESTASIAWCRQPDSRNTAGTGAVSSLQIRIETEGVGASAFQPGYRKQSHTVVVRWRVVWLHAEPRRSR